MLRSCFLALVVAFVADNANAADPTPDMKQIQGEWEVVELAEDGKVIPREAVREWLTSGGRFEIAENAIIFTSHDDGKKHVKLFSLDETTFPKGIDLSSKEEKKDGLGIYQFDKERLIVCFADPEESKRPTEFSAKEGSKQVLMTLQRVDAKPPVAEPKPAGTTARILTDAEVKTLLNGSWRYTDSVGALFVTFGADGTFSTVREVQQLRVFQKVFVRSPVTTGKWSVSNGTLTFLAQMPVHPERIGKAMDFSVRSISERDFIFVDGFGRVGQATRVQ